MPTDTWANIINKPTLISQAEAEAGVATTERTFSPLRIKQAIDALANNENELRQAYTTVNKTLLTGTALITTGSIPLSTDGTAWVTLPDFTPLYSDSIVVCEVVAIFRVSSATGGVITLSKDADANCMQASYVYNSATADNNGQIYCATILTTGTVTPISFKLRFGPASAATMYLNGVSAYFGAAGPSSSICIYEYAP